MFNDENLRQFMEMFFNGTYYTKPHFLDISQSDLKFKQHKIQKLNYVLKVIVLKNSNLIKLQKIINFINLCKTFFLN